MLKWQSLLAATAAICFLPQSAQSAPVKLVTVPPKIFDATWNDRIRTSGGDLLGVIGGEVSGRIAEATVVIGGITAADATICVTIRQVSGAYSARFSMPNPKLGPVVGFVLPRGKISASGLPVMEMAILARASKAASCSDRDVVLPAGWGALPAGKLLALVNDHQADRTRTVRPARMGDCRPLGDVLPGRALNVYQVACPVPLPAVGCDELPLAIQLDNAGKVDFIETRVRELCQ